MWSGFQSLLPTGGPRNVGYPPFKSLALSKLFIFGLNFLKDVSRETSFFYLCFGKPRSMVEPRQIKRTWKINKDGPKSWNKF